MSKPRRVMSIKDKEMTIKQVIQYFEEFYKNFDTQKAIKLLKDLNL